MRRASNLHAALGLLGAATLLLLTLLVPRPSWASAPAVQWGLHRIDLEHATVVVRSEWDLAWPATEPLELAAPLPAAVELSGAEAVRDPDGSIVALRLPEHAGTRPVVESRLPWSTVQDRSTLPVPIPAGHSVQRLVLDPALGFRPDPALGLIAQVGHYAPADFDVVARHRFDSRTDGDLRHVGAFYVRGIDLREAKALRGEVTLQRQRMGRAALVAGAIFVVLVLGIAVAHRRLGRKVLQERAEAFLAEELRALDDDDFALRPGVPPGRG